MNRLYYGDNLHVLREHIADESVDLIYLDPPFNSNANYNILFRSPKGHSSEAQIEAFEDTWHWGEQAEHEFAELVRQGNTDVSEMMQALRRFLGENDMMAYLTMMANRLLELHRVLKPTGSLYLHCDSTASHYLKVVLDGVFDQRNFKNEIVWKRTFAHSDPKRYGRISDRIFFYSKSDSFSFNPHYSDYSEDYKTKFFRNSDERGSYQLVTLTGPGISKGDSDTLWKGYRPSQSGRSWSVPKRLVEQLGGKEALKWSVSKRLDLLFENDYIIISDKGIPRFKHYVDAIGGTVLQDIWTDIPPISVHSAERLGYPTQKPLTLLERIVNVSSNPGDVVLDPFCGCGTAVHAAEKLGRKWVGIDITHLAIALIEKRLKDAFPKIAFSVEGTPKDLEAARDLAQRDKYQFQWWACALVGAQPYQGKKKGADGGIDGLIFFQDDSGLPKKIVVSVKGGDNVSVAMVRDLKGVMEKEKAEIGLFVCLTEPTKPMTTEAVSAGYYDSPAGKAFPRLQILTISDLLDGKARAEYPDLAQGGHTFKKAKRERKTDGSKQEGLF